MKKIFKSIFNFIISQLLITLNVFAGSDGTLEINNKTKRMQSTEVKDCFETINRGIFAFNQGLDKIFLNQLLKVIDTCQNQSDQEQVML